MNKKIKLCFYGGYVQLVDVQYYVIWIQSLWRAPIQKLT